MNDVQILGKTSANGGKGSTRTRTKIDKESLAHKFLRDFYEDDGSEEPIDINHLSEEMIAAEAEMIRTRKEYNLRKEEALAKMAPSQQDGNKKHVWDAWFLESSDVRPRADQTANTLFTRFLRASQLPPSAFCNHYFQDYIRHLNPYAQIPKCIFNLNGFDEPVKESEDQEKCILCDKYISAEDANALSDEELPYFATKYIMNGHFLIHDYQAIKERKFKRLCKTHNKTYDAFKLAYQLSLEEQAATNVPKPSSVRAAAPPKTTAAKSSSAPISSLPHTSEESSPQTAVAPGSAPVLAPKPAPAPVVKPKRQRKKKEPEVVPTPPVQMESSTPSSDASSPSSNSESSQVDSPSPTSTLADLLKVNPAKKSRARKRPNVDPPTNDDSPGLPIGSQIGKSSMPLTQKLLEEAPILNFQQLNVPSNSTAPYLVPNPINYQHAQSIVPYTPAPPVFVKPALTTQQLGGNLMRQEVPTNYLSGEPVFKKPCLPPARPPAANPRSRKAKDPNAPPRRRGGDTRSKQTSSDATISSTPLPGEPPSSIATSSSQTRTNVQFTDLPPVLSPVRTTAGNLDYPGQKPPSAPQTLSPQNSKQKPQNNVNLYNFVGAMDVYPKGVEVPSNAANGTPQITNFSEEIVTKRQAEEFEEILKKYSTGDSGSSTSSSPELLRPASNPDPIDGVEDPDESLAWNINGNPDESLMLGFDPDVLEELMKL